MEDNLSSFNNIKFPIIFLAKIVHLVKQNTEQENIIRLVLKFFFKFFHPYIINLNILKMFKKTRNTHYRIYTLIDSYQNLLRINKTNVLALKNYSIRYKNLVNKPVEKQIFYWKKKLNIINAINDATFDDGFFFKLIENNNSIIYREELLHRIHLISNTVNLSFFKTNDIMIFSIATFETCDTNLQNKIYLKLIKKINNIIKDDLILLEKYKKSSDLFKYVFN